MFAIVTSGRRVASQKHRRDLGTGIGKGVRGNIYVHISKAVLCLVTAVQNISPKVLYNKSRVESRCP